jgi:hypothetical protein
MHALADSLPQLSVRLAQQVARLVMQDGGLKTLVTVVHAGNAWLDFSPMRPRQLTKARASPVTPDDILMPVPPPAQRLAPHAKPESSLPL